MIDWSEHYLNARTLMKTFHDKQLALKYDEAQEALMEAVDELAATARAFAEYRRKTEDIAARGTWRSGNL